MATATKDTPTLKATIPLARLAWALGIAGPAVPSRPSLPSLSNVLITIDDGRMVVRATDLDVAVEAALDVPAGPSGVACVPAKLLTELVGALSGETVDLIGTAHGGMRVGSGTNGAVLKGIDTDQFPPAWSAPSSGPRATIRMPADTLHAALKRVAVAAAKEDSRPVLAGVLFRVQDGSLALAAADGFRLASQRLEVADVQADGIVDAIIPARSCKLIEQALKGHGDGEAVLTVYPAYAHLAAGPVGIAVRLIEGQFPNYEAIIPSADQPHVIRVHAGDLRRALRIVAPFAKDAANIVRLDAGEHALTLTSTSAEIGEGTAEVAANREGEPVSWALNAAYLADALDAIDGPVRFALAGPTTPSLLTPDGGLDLRVVIMPMHYVKE